MDVSKNGIGKGYLHSFHMSKTAWRQTRPHSLKHIDSDVLTRKPTALNKSHSLDENVIEDIPDTDSRNGKF